MAIPSEILRLARQYGPELDDVAAELRNPVTGRRLSGTALILKTLGVETGGTYRHKTDNGSLLRSRAGAQGLGQFMPGTRQEMIEKFNVDPWKDPESAVRGLVLHQQGKLGHAKGPRGYNPGAADEYESQVLNFKVGNVAPGQRGQGGPASSSPAQSQGGGTQTVQLPGAPQLDLQGLLERLQPAPKPQAMGVAPPKFAAGQQFASMPGAGAPPAQGPSIDLAGILASAQPPAGTIEQQIPGSTQPAQNGLVKPASTKLQAVIEEADRIDRAGVPYKWGGGHAGRQPRGTKVTPLDCSGAVSRVLGIDPRVSGQFTGWGRPGRSPGGKGVTIYSNDKHVLMEINGRFFGTSGSNPGGGAGWIPREKVSKEYLSRFTARHSRRLMG